MYKEIRDSLEEKHILNIYTVEIASINTDNAYLNARKQIER